jgi:MYXO-CTERM domain-containing protein
VRRVLVTLATIAWPTVASAAPCLELRPTDAGSAYGYGGVVAQSFALPNGKTRVWYAESGPHAPPANSWETVAQIADEALDYYASLGFVAPVSDGTTACPTNGGDDKVDIYLFDFGGSADGHAAHADCTATAGANVCQGFVLVDNAFAGYASFEEGARTVVPHELFHVVQAAADADIEAWWSEGTAQWATKSLHPDLDDLEKFLPSYFSDTDRPLDAPAGGAAAAFLYATAIWPVFLDEHFGTQLVVDIFDEMNAAPGASTEAMNTVLTANSSSLADAFTTFAVWNTATGVRASAGLGYENAASYPQVKLTAVDPAMPTSIADLTASLSVKYYSLPAGENRRVSIETDPTRNAAVLVPFIDDKALIDQAKPLPADTADKAIIVVAGLTTLKSDAPYTLKIDVAPVGSDAGTGGSSGTGGSGGSSGGNAAGDDDSGGCGCRTTKTSSSVGWLAFFLLGLGLTHRRARRERLRGRLRGHRS